MYGLIGENSFVREQELARIVGSRVAETFDGADLDVRDLADVLATQTLFSSERIVILRDAGTSKPLWDALTTQFDRIDDSLTVVLVETKLDKRTKAYKFLQQHAKLTACDYWSDRQTSKAEAWLASYAKEHGVNLESRAVTNMVRRAIRPSDIDDKPVIDQQLLASSVQQLAVLDMPVEPGLIDTVLPPVSHDNVFGLLAATLGGDTPRVRHMIDHLRHHQAGHRLMALVASQATNLAALVLAGNRSVDEVAADIGAHPYALRQLAPLAKQLDRRAIERAIDVLAQADWRAKSGAEVWGVIETALVSLAEQTKQPR